jgi:hypothetical protein
MRKQIWENLLCAGGFGALRMSGETRLSNDTLNSAADVPANRASSQRQLLLADDVDFGALSVKYELTGGFIKVGV